MTNGWDEWANYVLAELKALRAELHELRETVSRQDALMAALAERNRIWYAVATAAIAVAGAIGTVIGRFL